MKLVRNITLCTFPGIQQTCELAHCPYMRFRQLCHQEISDILTLQDLRRLSTQTDTAVTFVSKNYMTWR
jgi:hypothetical protein